MGKWLSTRLPAAPLRLATILYPNRFDCFIRAKATRLRAAGASLGEIESATRYRERLRASVRAWNALSGSADDEVEFAEIDARTAWTLYCSMRNLGWAHQSRIGVIHCQKTDTYHLGPGQHRTSALLALGFTALPARYYAILEYDSHEGWDARQFSSPSPAEMKEFRSWVGLTSK